MKGEKGVGVATVVAKGNRESRATFLLLHHIGATRVCDPIVRLISSNRTMLYS
jgi:hypothetical protein